MIKFGTSGFRAIIAEEFNKDNVQKIAQALAKIIQTKYSIKKGGAGCAQSDCAQKITRQFFDPNSWNKSKK